jgi:hypothetical protein
MNPPVKQTTAKQEPAGRVPILVQLLKFVTPQDGPGFSVASALTPFGGTGHRTGRPKFEISFLPWVRSFRVQYNPPECDSQVGFIPESRFILWVPLESLDLSA